MSMKDIFHDSPFGGGGDNEGRRRIPSFRIHKKLLALFGVVFALFIIFPAFATFYTDLLWFDALDLTGVFWTRLLPQWFLLAAAGAAAFVILSINWLRALKVAASQLDPEEENPLNKTRSWLLLLGIAALVSLMNGMGVRSEWAMVLSYLNRSVFGVTDPVFGHDVGFYVFSLPFFQLLQGWLLGVLTTALIGSAAIYVLGLLPTIRETNRFSFPSYARGHLSVLGALAVFTWGLNIWLERFNLLFSEQGVVFGAGYTDIHAKLLGLNVMLVLAGIVGVLLLANIFRRTWRLAIGALVLLIAANVILRGLYPGIVQKYSVEPNEFQKEEMYIQYNIDNTLKAYGLDDLKIVDFTPDDYVTRGDLDKDPETMRNLRLWDYRPLLRAYKQLQEIRSYYDFEDVDIDRYDFDGSYTQVMLSARELDLEQLQNPTWVNMHLEFTHGYGIVMNSVNDVDESGKPVLYVKDLPPSIDVPLTIDKPQIYYGEKRTPYVLVKTSIKEFDYPMGDSNVRSTYSGSGGVSVGSLWRRLLFALRFRDSQILFTDAITPDSRIMFFRSVRERLNKVAPFLLFDTDPYLTVTGGRLVWIQDAYTVTGNYPYSEPVTGKNENRVNYIRNSVKIAVDAYDGSLRFYIADPDDPLIQTWAKIFPGLFTPLSEASPEFCSHCRYPKGLFLTQSQIYSTYHMSDPNTFYNKEDVWQLSAENKQGTLDAYYVIMRMAGEEKAEFALIAPFMPMGRDNMIAWMAGRSDSPNYGEILVYQFPKQKLIYGPAQVEALIDQNPNISAQLSLWSQRGSDVIRGNLLVIPIGNSLLYVQPLYLRAENSDLPELKRVIVSTGGKVAWAETLDGALELLVGGQTKARPSDTAAVTPATPSVTAATGSTADLARQAKTHFDSAQQAARSGDWARYGQEIAKLQAVLESLLADSAEE